MKSNEKLMDEATTDGIKRAVAGAVVLAEDSVLILKRPKDDFMGGIYELPSGKIEDGETIIEGLCREVLEETGLMIKEIEQYVGFFDYTSGSGKKTRQFNFVVSVETTTPVVLTEHEEYRWIKLDEIGDVGVSSSTQEVLEAVAGLNQT